MLSLSQYFFIKKLYLLNSIKLVKSKKMKNSTRECVNVTHTHTYTHTSMRYKI